MTPGSEAVAVEAERNGLADCSGSADPLAGALLISIPIAPFRVAAALLAALLTAACGSADEDQPLLPPDELANRVELLRTARTEEEMRPPRLGRLTPADVGTRFRGRPSCRLESEGRTLLVAKGPAAVARIDNELRLLAAAGPVAPSGAFFKAPGVTISIGRSAPKGPGADASATAWPAGVTIGGAPDVPIEKRDAQWRCLS